MVHKLVWEEDHLLQEQEIISKGHELAKFMLFFTRKCVRCHRQFILIPFLDWMKLWSYFHFLLRSNLDLNLSLFFPFKLMIIPIILSHIFLSICIISKLCLSNKVFQYGSSKIYNLFAPIVSLICMWNFILLIRSFY